MAFNIQQFRSSFKNPLASTAFFDVSVTVPAVIERASDTAKTNENASILEQVKPEERINFRCQTAPLPSRTVSHINDLRVNGVPRSTIPYAQEDDQITTEFILEDGLVEKTFFDFWIEMATNPPHPSNSDGSGRFQPAYHNDIVSEVTVRHYAHDGTMDYGIRFVEAFPDAVSEIELGWANRNQPPILQVQWSFDHWEKLSGLL